MSLSKEDKKDSKKGSHDKKVFIKTKPGKPQMRSQTKQRVQHNNIQQTKEQKLRYLNTQDDEQNTNRCDLINQNPWTLIREKKARETGNEEKQTKSP